MNYILLKILVIIGTVSLMACSNANSEDTEVKLTVISSIERIGQTDPIFGASEADIKAAKNEYESFQVVVGAVNKNIRVVDAEISDLTGEAGVIYKNNIKLYRPEYVRVRRSSPRAQIPVGLYADPLVPFVNPQTGEPIEPHRHIRKKWPGPMVPSGYEMYAVPFDVWKGQNQPVWVDVYIPEDAIAGEYKGTFTVTLADFPSPHVSLNDNVDNKKISIPVNLTVWDFTLPDVPTLRNHFGHVRRIADLFKVEPNSEKYKEIEERYCRMFSEHRLNPPLPHRLMPEMNKDGTLKITPERHNELKKFIEDFHVADFEIPRTPIAGLTNPHEELTSDAKDKSVKYYRDYYKYVRDNGWDKRAYVYLYDEPNTAECYNRVRDLSALVKEGAPDLKVLVVEQPYTQDPSWNHIGSAVDIWCPLFGFIDRDSVDFVLSQGDEVWSYTALSQRAPQYHPRYAEVKNYDSPYWHIDAKLISHRTPSWMNYQYGITGLLYWSLMTRVLDPWYHPAFSHFGSHFNGGGYFIYPGVPCGIDGPIASIRLKNLRESMEDYEYFHIYEELAGREAVMKVVTKVAPNWWGTTEDPETILSNRQMIAEEIIRLKK